MKKLLGFTLFDILYMFLFVVFVFAIGVLSMIYEIGLKLDMYLYKFFCLFGF
jgi:hypothetical protein